MTNVCVRVSDPDDTSGVAVRSPRFPTATRHMTDIARFKVDTSKVVTRDFRGHGAQFNQHLYAAITGAPLEAFADLEEKAAALAPGLVRIFYNDRQASELRDKLTSFVLTVELAERVRAAINITWQSGGISDPELSMARLAHVLAYLVKTRGLRGVRWVTVQNEVNTTRITPEQNAAMYRALDRHLHRHGIREQIRFMSGDLTAKNQAVWFEFMAKNLSQLVEAYSVHIYWDYWDTTKLMQRLRDVKAAVAALPKEGRKPVYITEYGVRGKPHPRHPVPGVSDDGTRITETNIAAFQQAWFAVAASRLGYAGTIKWDLYFSHYDRGEQAYYALGPWQEGWPLYPTYHVLQLLSEAAGRLSRVVYVQAEAGGIGKQVSAYVSKQGRLAVVGLDERGGAPRVAAVDVAYTLRGVTSRSSFKLAVWNRDGDGRTVSESVTSDRSGLVTFTVPVRGVFSLTSA